MGGLGWIGGFTASEFVAGVADDFDGFDDPAIGSELWADGEEFGSLAGDSLEVWVGELEFGLGFHAFSPRLSWSCLRTPLLPPEGVGF